MFGSSGTGGGGKGGGAAGGLMLPPPEFAQLRAYWEGLRRGDGLPRRADIDPRGIAQLLETALLVERIAPGEARVRLAGMVLSDLLGMDLRGMPLSALILDPSRERFAAALERVFAGPAAGTFDFEAERGLGRPALSVALMLLPVAGQSGQTDRALGVMVLTGRIGRAPRRLALARSRIDPLAEPVPAPAPVAGMAEAAAPFDAGDGSAPRLRGHLKLVVNRDA
jgi:hypothetical protein